MHFLVCLLLYWHCSFATRQQLLTSKKHFSWLLASLANIIINKKNGSFFVSVAYYYFWSVLSLLHVHHSFPIKCAVKMLEDTDLVVSSSY
jgi:hypothetical protein